MRDGRFAPSLASGVGCPCSRDAIAAVGRVRLMRFHRFGEYGTRRTPNAKPSLSNPRNVTGPLEMKPVLVSSAELGPPCGGLSRSETNEYDATTWSARTWMSYSTQQLSVSLQLAVAWEAAKALGGSAWVGCWAGCPLCCSLGCGGCLGCGRRLNFPACPSPRSDSCPSPPVRFRPSAGSRPRRFCGSEFVLGVGSEFFARAARTAIRRRAAPPRGRRPRPPRAAHHVVGPHEENFAISEGQDAFF